MLESQRDSANRMRIEAYLDIVLYALCENHLHKKTPRNKTPFYELCPFLVI